MTLPTDFSLPPYQNYVSGDKDKDDLTGYLRELTETIEDMYSEISENVNGYTKTNNLTGMKLWVPVLKGSGTAGTFTYSVQKGVVYRQGLMVDVFFTVTWSSAGTGAGSLYLTLPYKVANMTDLKFISPVQMSDVTLTGGTGLMANARLNEYNCEFLCVGDGFTSTNQLVVGSGSLSGHLRYYGQSGA